MPYDIDDKLVIAVASSAVFDLSESDQVFQEHGIEAYREHQIEHENDVLSPGTAFPLVKRLLSLNGSDDADQPIEVILLSRNSPETGLRVFNSIENYQLNISRAAFLSGGDPFQYLDAFNAALFLSANDTDVKQAIEAEAPAGRVFPSDFEDDDSTDELRIAFDFDGVIADDSAETVHQGQGLSQFYESESEKASEPLSAGPLHRFFQEVAKLQERVREKARQDSNFKPRIKVSIVTARNAPAHKRVITTLRDWGIEVDETFFLGGIDKGRILKVLRPHIFFDDSLKNIQGVSGIIPSAHVPFGVTNQGDGHTGA